MFRSSLKTSHLLVAFLGLAMTLGQASRVFAQDEPATAAEATAATEANAEDAPIVSNTAFPSLIALDPSNTVWTLKVSNGRLKVNGDVDVNSSNRGAFWIADGSVMIENGAFNVAGGVSKLGRFSMQPGPNLGARTVADPIPEFQVDSPDKVISREKLFLQTDAQGQDTVLPPGIYEGGIFASGNGHITLQPGLYVISNGDFSVIGPTVEGKDVTIVMSGGKPGALAFSLGAKFFASAPTSGKWKNLLVVSRASGTFARGVDFSVAQGQMQGILYCPKSSVSVQSKGNVQVSKIVALNVDVTQSTLAVTGDLGTESATPENGATDTNTTDAAPAADAGAAPAAQ